MGNGSELASEPPATGVIVRRTLVVPAMKPACSISCAPPTLAAWTRAVICGMVRSLPLSPSLTRGVRSGQGPARRP